MRRVVLALLPVGPLCVAALRYLLPYYTASTDLGTARAVAAHPGRESAVLVLGVVALVTLLPGLLTVAAVLPRTRLRTSALALLVPGYLCLGALIAEDSLLWSAAHAHVPVGTTAALLAATHPAITVAGGVFVAGHVIGTVLLGVALMRAQWLPTWVGGCVAVSQPLHAVAFVVLGSPALDLVGWSLLAIGLAGVAHVLVRRPIAAPVPSPRPIGRRRTVVASHWRRWPVP